MDRFPKHSFAPQDTGQGKHRNPYGILCVLTSEHMQSKHENRGHKRLATDVWTGTRVLDQGQMSVKVYMLKRLGLFNVSH